MIEFIDKNDKNIITKIIPSKRINLIMMALEDSEAKVAIENKITEKFIVNIATRKCDTLSVILLE